MVMIWNIFSNGKKTHWSVRPTLPRVVGLSEAGGIPAVVAANGTRIAGTSRTVDVVSGKTDAKHGYHKRDAYVIGHVWT